MGAKAPEKFSGIFFQRCFLKQTELHIETPMILGEKKSQTSHAELVFTGTVECLLVYF